MVQITHLESIQYSKFAAKVLLFFELRNRVSNFYAFLHVWVRIFRLVLDDFAGEAFVADEKKQKKGSDVRNVNEMRMQMTGDTLCPLGKGKTVIFLRE